MTIKKVVMSRESIFSIVLCLGTFAGFSQSDNASKFQKPLIEGTFQMQPSLFGEPKSFETPVPNIMMLSKLEIPTANPENIKYKPIVYNWAKAAKRIEDYKFAQYACRKQDANGRDLIGNVITDEIMDQLFKRVLPH